MLAARPGLGFKAVQINTNLLELVVLVLERFVLVLASNVGLGEDRGLANVKYNVVSK